VQASTGWTQKVSSYGTIKTSHSVAFWFSFWVSCKGEYGLPESLLEKQTRAEDSTARSVYRMDLIRERRVENFTTHK